jgi:FkbM family methyltransferase
MSDRLVLPPRKTAFILASTDHGTMIVNRFDYKMETEVAGFGVGFKILNETSYESGEILIGGIVLESRRKHFGDGVVAVDCGANIGTHTVEWAKLMTGWGSVTAIEAQERIYYALAGNVTINNCFNAKLIHATVGNANGMTKIPQPDYLIPASFGSLELRPRKTPEDIGQKIDYTDRALVPVRAMTIDSLALKRVDLLKVDVEGMEREVLEGAKRTIRQFLPVIIIEHLKTGREKIADALRHYGYRLGEIGVNILAVHPTDKTSDGFIMPTTGAQVAPEA